MARLSNLQRVLTLQQRFRSLMHSGQQRVVQSVKDFDAKRTVDAVLDAPKQLQREWEKHGATGVLTKFPPATVLVFLMLTLFFVYHSGFLDDSQFRSDPEPSLKVNGDLEVYLPEGSTVLENIRTVEDDWSTNVMIIYIESPSDNITSQRILQEMAYVESRLNPVLSDPSDDVIYVLSLSTVIKEVNSMLQESEKPLLRNWENLDVHPAKQMIVFQHKLLNKPMISWKIQIIFLALMPFQLKQPSIPLLLKCMKTMAHQHQVLTKWREMRTEMVLSTEPYSS